MIPTVSVTLWAGELADEIWQERVPVEGTLELTRRCPLSCGHCYCPGPGSRGAEMSTAEVLWMLDEAARCGCLWLTFTGGEPLCHPDFASIYRHAVDQGFLVTLFTNGVLLDAPTRSLLVQRAPVAVEVSVYGASEEGYGRVTGRSEAWPLVRRNVEAAVAEGLPVSLKTVATRATVEELAAMADWADELGVGFRFDPSLNPRLDGERTPLDHRLPPDEVVALEARFPDRAEAWSQACALPAAASEPRGLGCGAGRTAFHLTAEGVLAPCLLLPNLGTCVRDGGFVRAWTQELPRILDLLPPGHPECGRCELAGACEHCPAWAYLEVGRWNGRSEYLCSLARLRAQRFGGPRP